MDGASFLSFQLQDPSGTAPTQRLNLAQDTIFSGNDSQIYDTVALPGLSAGVHNFKVVVGDRSALLIVDGRIGAAVRLTTQSRLLLETRSGGVTITNLAKGSAPRESGCAVEK